MELGSAKELKPLYEQYLKSNREFLHQCYKTYDVYKHDLYAYARRLFDELNGRGFKIIKSNNQTFSVGFIFEWHSELDVFVYITEKETKYVGVYTM